MPLRGSLQNRIRELYSANKGRKTRRSKEQIIAIAEASMHPKKAVVKKRKAKKKTVTKKRKTRRKVKEVLRRSAKGWGD